MVLPNSTKRLLGTVFYTTYKSPEAIDDAMSILKILDFSWNSSTQTLVDDSTGTPIPKDKVIHLSPWGVSPIKGLSNFDLDCMEKVLNTRIMKGGSVDILNPLFECIGWRMEKNGDTYRLHYVGGVDYWETHDYWNTDWKEPWNDEVFKDEKDLPKWFEDQKPPEEWI